MILNYFYMHMILEQKYPKPAIVPPTDFGRPESK